MIRRNTKTLFHLDPNTSIYPNDILVMIGEKKNLKRVVMLFNS